jgi:hypothetical protein
MNELNISQLNSAGTEFFSDSESYMNELEREELDRVVGGNLWLKGGQVAWNLLKNPIAQSVIFTGQIAADVANKVLH